MDKGVLGILWLILSCLGLLVLIFGVRYLRSRENMAMIEKGMDPKLSQGRPAPFISLKWGLLLVGAGAGLLVAYILAEHVLARRDQFGYHTDDSIAAVYFALIAIGGGLGLITSYRVEKKEILDKNNNQ